MWGDKTPNKPRNKSRNNSSGSPPFFNRNSTIAVSIRAMNIDTTLISARHQLWPQRFEQPLGQSRCVENRPQQKQAAPRIFLARGLDQHLAHFRIADKSFRALQQPDVKLPF